VNGIRSRTERGASAVEFALVVPFLCLLLFGMITTGFTYSDHLSITNAVREGARFGASSVYSQAASPGPPAVSAITPADWAGSVQQRVYDVYFNGGSTLTKTDVLRFDGASTWSSVIPGGAVGNNCGPVPATPSTSSGVTAGSCVVKVWLRKSANIQLVIAPTLNFDIGAKSVSYYGRKAASCTAE
jgi:hypothetical protein